MHMQKEETTGDHQEFDEMYRRTQAEIYKFIRYRVADKELAKDVLQETYYVAYKKWDILCEHSNPSSIVTRVSRFVNEFHILKATFKFCTRLSTFVMTFPFFSLLL